MTPNSPSEMLRTELLSILTDEFASEGVQIRDDKLLNASGETGARAGVYPGVEEEYPGDANALLVTVHVQVFNRFEISWAEEPDTLVSPTTIERWADRLRLAVKAYNNAREKNDTLWYFRVQRIDYLDDPTGNRTRFEATVIGVGNNDGEV